MNNKLSASQINTFDELVFDKQAAKEMFNTAMNFYSNQTAEFAKRHKAAWKEIIEQFDLASDVIYTTTVIDGSVCIMEKEKEDE